MREFLIALLTFLLEVGVFIAIARYLIRYAAKVFAEEFKKIRDK